MLAQPRLVVQFARTMTAVALVIASFSAAPMHAQAQNQFNQHLAAGEFGPAMALARQANPQQQGQMLRDIARAQALAGARSGSLATAGSILDGRARNAAMANIAGAPLVPQGQRGGGALADFDTLIDLIKSTIAPETWDDNGGPGAVDSFPGGVLVDTSGILNRVAAEGPERPLAKLRSAVLNEVQNKDLFKESSLRKVSLRRLEEHLQRMAAEGANPDEAMEHFAGIYEIKYVFVYPEERDIVLAGPAGPWHVEGEGRVVNTRTGKPVLHLDDFVVLLRTAFTPEPAFGCSITPLQENLARTRQFLAESAKKPLRPGQRERWVRDLRNSVGKQKIDVFGIDPRTRAARILVEADYRMKLVGMGLEDGVMGVDSYLETVKEPTAMNVLRWWFTLNYDAVTTTKEHDAYELVGQGVKVLSENELLTAQGKRVHTGQADELTSQFAASFTKHFDKMSVKYPVYAELKNIFDLGLVAGLMASQDLPGQVNWHMSYFDPRKESPQFHYNEELGRAPEMVESIVNHRVVNKTQIVAGVSGGVSADPRLVLNKDSIKVSDYGLMEANRSAGRPSEKVRHWWWD